MTARWYCLSDSGQAMLCHDEADALDSVAVSHAAYPKLGTYRAVQLVDVSELRACVAIASTMSKEFWSKYKNDRSQYSEGKADGADECAPTITAHVSAVIDGAP